MNDLIRIVDGNAELLPEIASKIAAFEIEAKRIKEAEDELKRAILSEFEKYGIIKIDTPELMINYIAATDRESLDTKALKEDLPDIYDTYVKLTKVKPSLRIKVK